MRVSGHVNKSLTMDRNSRPRQSRGNRGSAVAVPAARDDLAKTELHLDGLVVLKIVKHAHESPETTGILLGLDQEDHLEVTNCFPLLPDADERRQDKYTSEMLKLLRQVKIDNFNIGWYQSSPLNAFCTERFVQIQYGYQDETAGAAAIIYDPTSASLGSLYLKVRGCFGTQRWAQGPVGLALACAAFFFAMFSIFLE